MAVLTDAEIDRELASLNGWQRNGTTIQRVFRFADFKAAMQFVNKAMALVSHDSGGVTQRDVRMAGAINKIAG